MYQAKERPKIGQFLIFLSEIFLQVGKSRLNKPALDGKTSELGVVS
jgi:hypothetical protein